MTRKNNYNVGTFLKVKDLKKLLSDIPDEWYVTVTSSEAKRHVAHVTSVGILESEFEYPNKCLSFCCDDHSISEETDLTSKVLFDYFEKEIIMSEMEGDEDDKK